MQFLLELYAYLNDTINVLFLQMKLIAEGVKLWKMEVVEGGPGLSGLDQDKREEGKGDQDYQDWTRIRGKGGGRREEGKEGRGEGGKRGRVGEGGKSGRVEGGKSGRVGEGGKGERLEGSVPGNLEWYFCSLDFCQDVCYYVLWFV